MTFGSENQTGGQNNGFSFHHYPLTTLKEVLLGRNKSFKYMKLICGIFTIQKAKQWRVYPKFGYFTVRIFLQR